MLIKMVKSHSGSYDGLHVKLYEKDTEHEVDSEFMPYSLAEVFLEHGMAVEVKESKIAPPGPKEVKR